MPAIPPEKLAEITNRLKAIADELKAAIEPEMSAELESETPEPEPTPEELDAEAVRLQERIDKVLETEKPTIAEDPEVKVRVEALQALKDSDKPEDRDQLRALLFALTADVASGGYVGAKARYVLESAGMT